MKIIFKTEKEKLQFSNWLKEIQGYIGETEMSLNSSYLFETSEEALNHAKNNIRKAWYRIYDISDSMFEVK